MCIGKMNAGVVMNAVPAECRLEGTFRAFYERRSWTIICSNWKCEIQNCKKHRIDAEIIYKAYYKEVINDKTLLKKLKFHASEMGIKFNNAEMVFTGEDFGFYRKIQWTFILAGSWKWKW